MRPARRRGPGARDRGRRLDQRVLLFALAYRRDWTAPSADARQARSPPSLAASAAPRPLCARSRAAARRASTAPLAEPGATRRFSSFSGSAGSLVYGAALLLASSSGRPPGPALSFAAAIRRHWVATSAAVGEVPVELARLADRAGRAGGRGRRSGAPARTWSSCRRRRSRRPRRNPRSAACVSSTVTPACAQQRDHALAGDAVEEGAVRRPASSRRRP